MLRRTFQRLSGTGATHSSAAPGPAAAAAAVNRAAVVAASFARHGGGGIVGSSGDWGGVGGVFAGRMMMTMTETSSAARVLQRTPGGGRRTIFIQTQSTPNPASLMFMPGKPVYEEGGSKNFANMREAMASPLAKKLFNIDGVTSVFFGADFVTVTKNDDHEWGVLKPEVFAAIMDFYASGEPIISDEAELAAAGTAITDDDDEIVAMIKELLETRIRPAVAEDGGDIVFRGWDAESGVVTVKMQGACDGCPSSSVTLKSGIENMLRHYVPEVNAVVQEEAEEGEGGGSMDLLDMATMNR